MRKPVENEELVELNKRMSLSAIERYFSERGISIKRTTISKRFKNMGIEPISHRRKVISRLSKMIELSEQGLTLAEIGNELDIHPDSVSQALTKADKPRRATQKRLTALKKIATLKAEHGINDIGAIQENEG